MTSIAQTVAISLVISVGAILAYDRLVVKPGQVIGVVDIADVYRVKEAEISSMLQNVKSEGDRQKAYDQAQGFGDRLDKALSEIPAQCRCTVMIKSAIAGSGSNSVDLTPLLKAKLGARP
jgi:hypothetical protein